MRMAKREEPGSTPICRCRVLYLGSSVPQVTKDGLQGIQEPLRELYPAEGAVSARGIDSWLSVWSNGLLLENVDENQKRVTRFFPIESLHYCAAVRYVVVSGGKSAPVPRFLPLDSPFARNPNINHPPLFACIMRRTSGIKVLECHAFICKRETPANALVGCCFHAYADSMYAKRLEAGNSSQYGSVYAGRATEEMAIEVDYTGDLSSANSEIIPVSAGSSPTHEGPSGSNPRDDEVSLYNGDENHKVWAGASKEEQDPEFSDYSTATIRSARSVSSLYGTSSRINRPRQMVMPSVAPPPPPAPEADKQPKKGKKDKKHEDEMNKITNGELMGRPPSVANDRRIPVNGSLPRPINGAMGRPVNGSLMRSTNGHSLTSKSKGRIPKMFSSLAERKSKSKRPPPPFVMLPGPPPAPHMGHPAPHKGHPTPHMGHPAPHMGHPAPHLGHPAPHMGHLPPNMMPPPMHIPPNMMPVPHGQGPMPPHPMGSPGPMGMYGLYPGPPAGRRPLSRSNEEPIYMPSSRPMSPTASYQPGHFPHEQYLLQQYATAGKPKHKKGKKKKGQKEDEEEDVYGRKIHLNEKAFSHSIREEHRSRSYSSLVGVGAEGSSVNKKDREIMQMVADLDLSGDEIERVEARPGVYRPPRSEISGTVTSRSSRQ